VEGNYNEETSVASACGRARRLPDAQWPSWIRLVRDLRLARTD